MLAKASTGSCDVPLLTILDVNKSQPNTLVSWALSLTTFR